MLVPASSETMRRSISSLCHSGTGSASDASASIESQRASISLRRSASASLSVHAIVGRG